VVDYITSQPGDWLQLTGRKVMLLVNATEMLDTESQESYAEWSWPLAAGSWIGHFGVLIPLTVVGLFVTWPQRRRLWVLHAMAAAYAASVVLFFVFARYRYPLVPFLLLFSAAGIAGGRQFWQAASARLRTATATVVASCLVLAHADARHHREQPRHGVAAGWALRRGRGPSPARDRHDAGLRARA